MTQTSDTPRERRAEKMRQTIIHTALDLLVETGLDQLSLREIARRMDYTAAALYEYFNNKDEIISALVSEADRMLTAEMDQAIEGLSPRQKLVESGLSYIRFAQNNPELYSLFSSAPAPVTPPSQPECQGGKSYQLLKQIITEGLQKGYLIPQPALGLDGLAYACWAIVHGIASLQLGAMKNTLTSPDFIHREMLTLLISSFVSKEEGK
jgi:AcrR family transcriptional regulator